MYIDTYFLTVFSFHHHVFSFENSNQQYFLKIKNNLIIAAIKIYESIGNMYNKKHGKAIRH